MRAVLEEKSSLECSRDGSVLVMDDLWKGKERHSLSKGSGLGRSFLYHISCLNPWLKHAMTNEPSRGSSTSNQSVGR